MKIKKTGAGLVFLVLLSQTAYVSAHDIGNKYLFSGPQSVDIWTASCLNGSSRMVARVLDQEPGLSNVSLLVYKVGDGESSDKNLALNTVDARGGNSTYSPFITINGGDGEYKFIVSQSKSLLDGDGFYDFNQYSINYHCEYANGNHSDTTIPEGPDQNELPDF